MATQPSTSRQRDQGTAGDREGKRKKVSVLIGNHEDSYSQIIIHCIACSGEYEVVATTTGYAEKVVMRAQSQEFDLCIVILNNLIYPTSCSSSEEYTERALKFVTQLKRASQSPVIAFTGWQDDPSFGERVKQAGASYFFWLPFPPSEFISAVKKCLSAQ